MDYVGGGATDDTVTTTVWVPPGHGLWIHHGNEQNDRIHIETCPDCHYPEIHPNCYGPAFSEGPVLLHGGGSGTAVFGGTLHVHGGIQEVVCKHGGESDARQVLGLARLQSELRQRRRGDDDILSTRIPRLVGVYISPHHVRDRRAELWSSMRAGGGVSALSYRASASSNSQSVSVPDAAGAASWPAPPRRNVPRHLVVSSNGVESRVDATTVHLTVPVLQRDATAVGLQWWSEWSLAELLGEHDWKVTLVQSRLHGTDNGADVYTNGRLCGKLLQSLHREFAAILTTLEHWTRPEEQQCDDEVQFWRTLDAQDTKYLSSRLDAFCGHALLKNFGPLGRLATLRSMGQTMKNCPDLLYLTAKEQVPVRFLGRLLTKSDDDTSVFVGQQPPCALDIVCDYGWQKVAHDAASCGYHKLMWTCGLTDAGLHNMFLSEDRVELFDLGEASLQTLPAFLTKFLMCFFHTLGMQSDGAGSWKRQFDVVENGRRLQMTKETSDRMGYVNRTFTETVNYLMNSFFGNDPRVRALLYEYVVLQLLSDGAFCLIRWERKGGGSPTYDCDERPLDKWLWRCLWDLYMASYVHSRYLAPLEGNVTA